MPTPHPTTPISHLLIRYTQRMGRIWLGMLVLTVLGAWSALLYVTIVRPYQYAPITITLTSAANIASNQTVQLQFNMSMATQSVNERIEIIPPHAVDMSWDRTSTQLTITPRTPWQANQSYRISVTSGARSQSQSLLGYPWYSTFHTDAALLITSALPQADQVALDAPIVVRFNRQMVGSAETNQPLTNRWVSMQPATDLTAWWPDTHTLVLTTTTLLPNTNYRVSIPDYISDINGAPMLESFSWQFATLQPHVLEFAPTTRQSSIGLSTPLVITMTGALTPAQLNPTINVWPTTAINTVVTNQGQTLTRLEITPQTQWQTDTRYRLRIGGPPSALQPFTVEFTTVAPFQLIAQTPAIGTLLQPNQELRLVFNSMLDTQHLGDLVTFDPAPATPPVIQSSGRDIRVSADWALDTPTTIQVSPELLSIDGQRLGKAVYTTVAVNMTSGQISLPGATDRIYDASTSSVIALTGQTATPHLYAIYNPPASSLVRLLTMPSSMLSDIDPQRYNIPLLATSNTTRTPDGRRWQIELTDDIRVQTNNHLVLLQLLRPDGSRDSRIVRIRPSVLYVSTRQRTMTVGVHANGAPQGGQRIQVFQASQLLAQGNTDEQGTWQSRSLAPIPQGVVLLNGDTLDARRITFTPTVISPQPELFVNQATASAGQVVQLALIRSQTAQSAQHTVQLQDNNGQIYAQVNIGFAIGQAVATQAFVLPQSLETGLYRFMLSEGTTAVPVIVHHTPAEPLHIDGTMNGTTWRGRVFDGLNRPIKQALVYWDSPAGSGVSRSNDDGSIAIPLPWTNQVTLRALDATHVGIRTLTDINPPPLVMTTPTPWVASGQTSTLVLGVRSPERLNEPVILTIVDPQERVLIRRILTMTANDAVSLDLQLPDGVWNARLQSGALTTQQQLLVNAIPANTSVYYTTASASTQIMMRPDPARYTLMTAEYPDSVAVEWLAPAVTLRSWQPISDTTPATLTLASNDDILGFAAQPRPATTCAIFRASIQLQRNGTRALQVDTSPDHLVALHLRRDPLTRVACYPNTKSDRNGRIALTLAESLPQGHLHITAVVHTEDCVQTHAASLAWTPVPPTTIVAPSHVAVGDVVVVQFTTTTATPDALVNMQLTPQAMNLLDPLPQYQVQADAQGVATFQWKFRITADQPLLLMSPNGASPLRWQPELISAPASFNDDGFVLDGRTSINSDAKIPWYDLIRTDAELARVMAQAPYSAYNPSHLAHRYWLSTDLTQRRQLLTTLQHMQLPDGSWGWIGSDPLITADVVNALSQAGVESSVTATAVPYLQQQLNNPDLPVSIRAIIVYTLYQAGSTVDEAVVTLSQQRIQLGNEGLAALILSLTADTVYLLPPLLDELTQRVQSSPRGIFWETDPATQHLHDLNSVNALIFMALNHIPSNREFATQLEAFLLSRRGVNSWENPITDARMWQVLQTIIPALNGQQRTSLLSQNGSFQRNVSVSPAQPLRADLVVESDAPVLVGMSRPRQQIANSDDAVIVRTVTPTLDLQRPLQVGDTITMTVDVIALTPLTYFTLVDVLPAQTRLVRFDGIYGFPVNYTHPFITQIGHMPHAQSKRYSYTLQLTQAGQFNLPGIRLVDAAGTIHAQSQPYVVAVDARTNTP